MATDREIVLTKIYANLSENVFVSSERIINLCSKLGKEKEVAEDIFNQVKTLLRNIKNGNEIWSDLTKDMIEESEGREFNELLKKHLGDNLPRN